MRIGIDARFYGSLGKGLGRYTQKLITHLEKIDRANEYIIFLRRENWQEYEPASSNFKKVLADYRWYSLAEQIFFPGKIRSHKLDLMHFAHFNVPILYFGKFIVTIHDLILTRYPTERATTLGPLKYALKQLAYRLVIGRAVKRSARIIAVSKHTQADIIKYFHVAAEKVIVTYEAVDPPMPLTGNQAVIMGKYGIKPPYLLYVGNIYPHKNIGGLVEAYVRLQQQRPDVSLVLVGKEDYFVNRLQREVAKMNLPHKVIFTGYVPDEDLPYLYRNASVYVFPSFYEGFGLPGLEACNYGLPVVASNSSCLPEVLANAALYFNPYKNEEMLEKIMTVLDQPAVAAKLRAAGALRVRQYSWEKMAQDTLALYNQV